MKKSFLVVLTTFAVILGAVGFSFAKTPHLKKMPAQTGQLAAQLPASDAVVVLEMQRLMKTNLPQILSDKMQIIGDVNAKLDEIKAQTGVDLRQFDQVAAGLMFKKAEGKKFDFDPVILARGQMNVNSLLALAKIASKSKYREETVGTQTIYVFLAKEILLANKPQSFKTPEEEAKFNEMLNSIPAEIAAAALNDKTLAIGMPARVRETVAGQSHVSQDVLTLVNRKPTSMVRLGGNMPPDAAKFFNLDDDEIGKNVNAIKQISGAVDLNDGNAAVSILAKTAQPADAKNLQDTLDGLRMFGGAALAMSKRPDQQVYARWAQNAKITYSSNNVMLDLQIPQNDINVLLGQK